MNHTAWTSEYFERPGGIRLHIRKGPVRADALVLVPAQMATVESYRKVLEPLSRRFQVYVLDPRGHGRSSWTPGRYNWTVLGEDLAAFLREVVRRPAIVSGNSSGGLMALWAAANAPTSVRALVLEDAPLFSAQWPRFAQRDRFVYQGLKHLVAHLGDPAHPDFVGYLRGLTMPVDRGNRIRRLPGWIAAGLGRVIERRLLRDGRPVDIRWLPGTLGLYVRSLSAFDPDFARAFVDGRMYEGLDHADALVRVQCPTLVIHGPWARQTGVGLVGAMDDHDAQRVRALLPRARWCKTSANHVMHYFDARGYVGAIERFAQQLDRPAPQADR